MRIARQDSIFIFGLEPFKIKEHNVIVIPIPPHWKKPILQTLKNFLGITAESVYCDDYGLATANSKLKYYEKMIDFVFSNELFNVSQNEQFNFAGFQNGMSCLLNEQYEVALKFFLEYESSSHLYLSTVLKDEICIDTLNSRIDCNTVKNLIDIELHFSKALCYKNMGQREAAIYEYELALNKYTDKNSLINTHIENKLYKILNDYIDLLYDKEDFDKVKSTIDEYINKFLNENDKLTYFIQTMKNEVVLLRMLKEKSFKPENINVDNAPQPLYNVLNQYFKLIACLGAELSDEIVSVKETYEEMVNIAYSSSGESFQNKTKWNLKDIECAINKYYKDDEKKLLVFNEVTSKLKGTIDFINAKYTIASY